MTNSSSTLVLNYGSCINLFHSRNYIFKVNNNKLWILSGTTWHDLLPLILNVLLKEINIVGNIKPRWSLEGVSSLQELTPYWVKLQILAPCNSAIYPYSNFNFSSHKSIYAFQNCLFRVSWFTSDKLQYMSYYPFNFRLIIYQVVSYRRLKTKEKFKLLVLKVVAVTYERWPLTRGSKDSDLTWKLGNLEN